MNLQKFLLFLLTGNIAEVLVLGESSSSSRLSLRTTLEANLFSSSQ